MVKIIFMGTPHFALSALKALHSARYEIAAVYTQPPRPKGRGQKDVKSPVHEFAENNSIPIHTPISLKRSNEWAIFQSYHADVAVVAAYGLILPQEILKSPKLGCVNIHASILPRWRGAAPIQRCIEAGDKESGITLMKMDAGLDTGDIITINKLNLERFETYESLHNKLENLGAKSIVENMADILSSAINQSPQPTISVTYAHKLKKEESELDTNLHADILEKKIRAFTPWPGAYIKFKDENIKIIEAIALEENNIKKPSGELFYNDKNELFIKCYASLLQIIKLQKANSKACSAIDFINGYLR